MMSKPILGTLLGAVLGILDGVSALAYPDSFDIRFAAPFGRFRRGQVVTADEILGSVLESWGAFLSR